MKRHQSLVALRWPGLDSLEEAGEAIAGGHEVEITLPEGAHYALCRRLQPAGEAAESLDIEGGVEILDSIAPLQGLEDLAQLREALGRADYRVRLSTPDPVLRLAPPGKRGSTA